MFVKIVTGKGNVEHVFECKEYLLHNVAENDDACILLDNSNSIPLKKHKDSLYIMNDGGKTIDSFTWEGKKK